MHYEKKEQNFNNNKYNISFFIDSSLYNYI